MKQKKTRNGWKNAIAAGAIGLGALAFNVSAQTINTKPSSLEFKLRNAVVDKSGLTTQNDFTYKQGDYTVKGMLEALPDAEQVNYGLDFIKPEFRLDLGYGDRKDSDSGRVGFTYYPEKDSSKSFIGGNFQYLPGDDRFIGIGGLDLTDELHVEGTADTKGNARIALFPKLNDSSLGIGIGRNSEGDWDANFSYNTESVWANVKYGPNRPFDARLVFGKFDKGFSNAVSSVTGQGDNELDVYPDQTFKFDIANGFFNFFGVGAWVGPNQGDWAVDLRYQEDRRAQANAGYRIGDVGFLKNSVITGGVYRNLSNDTNGATIEYGFTPFDTNSRIRIRADVNEKNTTVGGFLELRF
jgi:hypothetical protein